jgi:hypothetical protein
MANFYSGRVGKHRNAKYYELTKAGRLKVEDEAHNGDRIASAIGRVLQAN